MGTVQEMVHAAGRAVTDRVPPLRRLRHRLERGAGIERWRRIDRVLRWGRWLVLAWAIIGALITGTMVFREADPWIALLSVAEFELSLNRACPMAIPVNTRTRVTDTSCTGCLECVGACPSKNGLTVTLAMPTFRAQGATTMPAPDPQPGTEREIAR